MYVLSFCFLAVTVSLFACIHAGRLSIRLAAATADARRLASAAETAEQRQREMESHSTDLALANRDLRSRSQSCESFLRNVTHDLRTPFLSLQWFSSELVRSLRELRHLHASIPLPLEDLGRLESVDRDMEKAVSFLEAATASSSQTLKSLQQLCHVGQVEYSAREVDVEETVLQTVDKLGGILEEKGARVTVQSLPQAWGDPAAVELIFDQLLSNAVQYLDPVRAGVIEVGGEGGPPQSPPTYWVRDNGRGIPAASQSRLGVPFQRFHPDAGAGEGIGLALVLCAVERHGGRLRFESREGAGTTVFVTLSNK